MTLECLAPKTENIVNLLQVYAYSNSEWMNTSSNAILHELREINTFSDKVKVREFFSNLSN